MQCSADLELVRIWSILPALELLPVGVNSWGGATPMQAKWIKLDLILNDQTLAAQLQVLAILQYYKAFPMGVQYD